jgi:hypothetical protein
MSTIPGLEAQTDEDKLRRQNAILEGRVLKLTHENTHLKQEVAQLGRSLEDITRRYSQTTIDSRKAFQANQELTTRHSKETADLLAQLTHQHHQVAAMQQQISQYQHQLHLLSAVQQPQTISSIPSSHVLETSVYVFDKNVQTDPQHDPVNLSKHLSDQVKELTRSESSLRRAMDQRDAEASERSQMVQHTQRSLQDATAVIQKLSQKPTVAHHSTDTEGLPRAVPLADEMVFYALNQMQNSTSRPIQIKLVVDADPLRHSSRQVHDVPFEHIESVANVEPCPDGIYTFASDLPAPRWDDESGIPDVGRPRRQRGNGDRDGHREQQHSVQNQSGGGYRTGKGINQRGYH